MAPGSKRARSTGAGTRLKTDPRSTTWARRRKRRRFCCRQDGGRKYRRIGTRLTSGGHGDLEDEPSLVGERSSADIVVRQVVREVDLGARVVDGSVALGAAGLSGPFGDAEKVEKDLGNTCVAQLRSGRLGDLADGGVLRRVEIDCHEFRFHSAVQGDTPGRRSGHGECKDGENAA
jgi:hypothetical protein